MTVTGNADALPAVRPTERRIDGLIQRLRGPGGYYNIGNVLALVTGLGLQVTHGISSGRNGLDIVGSFFAGSPAAVAFTAASAIFIVGGEVYHRGWKDGAPVPRLTRIGDLLSALGGIALAVSLVLLGQVLLAVLAGALMVAGKLGSAAFGDGAIAPPLWPAGWPDPFRVLVLVSRIPALGAPAVDLMQQLELGSPAIALVQPVVLIVCQLLWTKADLLLLGNGRRRAVPAAG